MVSSELSNTQPIAALGNPLQKFHLRWAWLGRWGTLILAFIFLAGAATVLVFGAYQAYLYYYRFGPAIVWKTVELPIILVVIFLAFGLMAARIAYVNWKREATLYENGFTYQDHQGIQVWRWNEIQNYRNIIYRNYAIFLNTGDTHKFLVINNNGQTLILNDDLEMVEQLTSTIRKKVFPRLYAQLSNQFQAGKTLKFGPLVVSLADGIEYHKKAYRLEKFDSIGTRNGSLQIILRNGSKRETLKLPAGGLPNLDILLAILAEIKSKNYSSQPYLQPVKNP
jgi:hypothetical protein